MFSEFRLGTRGCRGVPERRAGKLRLVPALIATVSAGIGFAGAEPRIEADFNYAAERPAWVRPVTEADFPVDPERIRSVREFRPVFGSRERLSLIHI